MKVKFVNLAPDNGLLQELQQAYLRVMTSGQYIGGPEIEAFEQEWADYCGTEYCVSCSSGQAALELLLKAYGVGYGDEVIVPSWTAVPTWKAVLNVGAIPRPVDVNPDTFLLDEISLSKHTKAAIAVHLYGYRSSCNIISDYDAPIAIIEDACQAHGLKLGHRSNAAWSFYPTKNLGAYGDGGAITTNDKDLGSFILHSRDSNRLDPLQAAFLRVKLGRLSIVNGKRLENALIYDSQLLMEVFTPPQSGMYHQYVFRTDKRDELRAYLAGRGIETMIHYPLPPHRVLGFDYDLPVADKLAQTVLSLPITCSQEQVEYVCEVINEFYTR